MPGTDLRIYMYKMINISLISIKLKHVLPVIFFVFEESRYSIAIIFFSLIGIVDV